MKDAKHTFKTIGAVFCCVLCLAVIAGFAYTVSKTSFPEKPELYTISNNVFLNGFYRYLMNGIGSDRFFLIFGLAALLCEILFSKPLIFLFSQLPLGRINSPTSIKPLTFKTRLIPAFLIGIAAAINIFYAEFKPDSFAENAQILNWIFLAVIGLAFVAQLTTLLTEGGIWRSLVSGGLLIAANVSIGALFGMLVTLLSVVFLGLVIGIGMLLLGSIIFKILFITTG